MAHLSFNFIVLLCLIIFSSAESPILRINDGVILADDITPKPYYKSKDPDVSDTQIEAEIKLEKNENPMGVDNFEKLTLTVQYSKAGLKVKIIDKRSDRWEVPNEIYHQQNFDDYTSTSDECPLQFNLIQDPFSFSVVRKSNSEVLFNTTLANSTDVDERSFYFSDQYLQIGSSRASKTLVYGLGERMTNLSLRQGYYTIWNLAQDDPINFTYPHPKGDNIYGFHPFMLQRSLITNTSFGLLLRTSNALDVNLESDFWVYKFIGGIMELHFFSGSSPEQVIQQYHHVIGKPYLPPYWGMGWHQCRWGYNTTEKLYTVYNKYEENKIPLDAIWSDIDYMNDYEDFTLDTTNFPNMTDFISMLHNNNKHYVPIVDSGIKNLTGYFGYDTGVKDDIFMKRYYDSDTNCIGNVWPKASVFTDFFNPASESYWEEMLDDLHEAVAFDGLWLDMDEPSNFCNGENSSETMAAGGWGNCTGYYPNPEPEVVLPYTPGNRSLEYQLLPLRCSHHGGKLYIGYNTHPLYGMMECLASNTYLAKTSKRPFIITRSTYFGNGQYSGHWLGDSTSLFVQLQYTLPGILAMNMFGIDLIGADICGFHGNTTSELCTRWYQVGAFYTFSRNHNDKNKNGESPYWYRGQEPYTFDTTTMDNIKSAMQLKYSILVYMYTQMFNAHINGGTVLRPFFFEFPNEAIYSEDNYQELQDQFFVGSSLMTSPVIIEGDTSKKTYFPAETFYDFYTGEKITTKSDYEDVDAPLSKVPLFIRENHIIPIQTANDSVLNVEDLRKQPINLLIASTANETASGSFILDDGISFDAENEDAYSTYEAELSNYTAKNNTFQIKFWNSYFNYNPSKNNEYPTIDNITIYGIHTFSNMELQINDTTSNNSLSYDVDSSNDAIFIYHANLDLSTANLERTLLIEVLNPDDDSASFITFGFSFLLIVWGILFL